MISDALTNIANVEIDLGETDSAEKNLHEALIIQRKLGDDDGIGRTLNTIGYIHRTRGNDSLALEFYDRALKIRIKTGNRIGAAACYNNIAFIYRSRKDFTRAINYYEQAITIYESEDALIGSTPIYGNLANCYFELGKYDKAVHFGLKGYEIAEKQMITKDLLYLTKSLYRSYKQTGNYESALFYFERHKALNDSATSEKHYKELINQRLEHEFINKEQVIVSEQEKKLALEEMKHTNRDGNFQGGKFTSLSFHCCCIHIVVDNVGFSNFYCQTEKNY